MFLTRTPYHSKPRALAQWLLVVAALVFGIVIVGGITRLTESGLSIVKWDPLLGTLPPLTHAQWQAAFDGYKAIPQYAAFNKSMTLEGFQHIYFWEYCHRLLARAIGTVLAIVLIVFWWKRWIPKGYGPLCWLIFALGALQGLIGWWMVASGLQDRVEVSHLRLATHLLAAMLIYGVLIWTALDLFAEARGQSRARLLLDPASAIFALAVQLMLGAFTAGLRAGYAFSSWPLMGDSFFPAGGWKPHSIAFNLFYNPVVVQFIHRWWAWVVVMVALLLAQSAWRKGGRVAGIHVIVLVALQIGLGIATLLTGVMLPIAVAHQAVAALLLGCFVWCAHVVGTAPNSTR